METTIPVNITVVRAVNMGKKPETLQSFLQVEFKNAVLGHSEKLNFTQDRIVEYNFKCTFQLFDGNHTLNDVAQQPVLITVIEVVPKSKKQKEEKVTPISQAVVDLLELLEGKISLTCTAPLHPVQGLPVEEGPLDAANAPALHVTVCVDEPLLSETQLSGANMLRMGVESIHSLPQPWRSSAAAQYSYTAAMPLPLTAEKDEVLVFCNGGIKTASDKEIVPRPKKWPLYPLLAPSAQYITGALIKEGPKDIKYGDLTSDEDIVFRTEAEKSSYRVNWDTERRYFMDADAVECMSRQISASRLWPLEVMRLPQSGASKSSRPGREKSDDELKVSFHGVAFVDLASLLYPGVQRIRGAYLIHPFYEEVLQAKTRRNSSILQEAILLQNIGVSALSSLGSGQQKVTPVKDSIKVVKDPSRKSVRKQSSSGSIKEGGVPLNTEGMLYVEERSYIVIEIVLEKPLVPRRTEEEILLSIKDLIPCRPPPPNQQAGAEKAVQAYHAQITSVVIQVLDQYQQLFGSQPQDPKTQGQRRSQLLAELNCSGKYFAFKEQLKHSVVRLVREKMLRTEAFTDQEQLEAFLSQLYIYLVDQMHVALNKTLSMETLDGPFQYPLDDAQLRLFAKEAEINQDYPLAAMYYQERLTRDRKNPIHWFEYGVLHMMTGDYQKAEECFQQAAAMEQIHLPSLLMCGILAEIGGQAKTAETFFEGATRLEPKSETVWTVFGLFYESQENSIMADMAFQEANKLRTLSAIETGEDRAHSSIYMKAAQFLMESRACQMAQRALAHELLCPEGGPTGTYFMTLSRLQMMIGEYCDAKASLQEALKCFYKSPDPWALLGHAYYLSGNLKEARTSYERSLDFVEDSSEINTVLLRLGHIYLLETEFTGAKDTYLRACGAFPSCITWLRLGISCYRLGQLVEAEHALIEANILNNTNAEVWAYLSLICLQTGRRVEAEQSYKYAMKLKLQNMELLKEIEELQTRVGFGSPSF